MLGSWRMWRHKGWIKGAFHMIFVARFTLWVTWVEWMMWFLMGKKVNPRYLKLYLEGSNWLWDDACTTLLGVVLSLLAMNYFVCALKKKKNPTYISFRFHVVLQWKTVLFLSWKTFFGMRCCTWYNLHKPGTHEAGSNSFSLVGASIIHTSRVLSILTHDTSDHRPREKVLGSNYICPSTPPYKESYNWYVYIGAHIIFLRDYID
jgi:hypothetical protein